VGDRRAQVPSGVKKGLALKGKRSVSWEPFRGLSLGSSQGDELVGMSNRDRGRLRGGDYRRPRCRGHSLGPNAMLARTASADRSSGRLCVEGSQRARLLGGWTASAEARTRSKTGGKGRPAANADHGKNRDLTAPRDSLGIRKKSPTPSKKKAPTEKETGGVPTTGAAVTTALPRLVRKTSSTGTSEKEVAWRTPKKRKDCSHRALNGTAPPRRPVRRKKDAN